MNKQAKKKKQAAYADKQKEKAAKKKRENTLIFLWTVAGLLAVALLATGIVFAVRGIKRLTFRESAIYKTEHCRYTSSMLTYSFYNELINERALETVGVGTVEELKEISFSGSLSYYDYYLNDVKDTAKSVLCFAEAAKQNHIELDESDRRYIDNKLTAIESAAALRGAKVKDYLAANYGDGVTLNDVERVLELELLSQRNADAVELGITVTEDEVRASKAKIGALDYDREDFYLFGLTVGSLEGDSDAVKKEKELAAYEKARELAAAASLEEFLDRARVCMTEECKADGYTGSELEDRLDVIFQNAHYIEMPVLPTGPSSRDSAKWLYDAARQPGDTVAYPGTSEACAFYFLKRYSVDIPNDAFRVIRVRYDNYAARSEAIAAFNAICEEYESGEHTEDAFAALARVRTDDRVAAVNGGYTDDTSIDPTAEYVPEIKQLIAKHRSSLDEKGEELRVGDSFEVYGSDAMYLLYYCGKGQNRSDVDVREALRIEKFSAAFADYTERYPVDDGKRDAQIAPLNVKK